VIILAKKQKMMTKVIAIGAAGVMVLTSITVLLSLIAGL